MYEQISKELKNHVPFTAFGVVTGIIIMIFFQKLSSEAAYKIFYILHPLHVILSALVTASIYKLHTCGHGRHIKGKCNLWILLVVGYVGSIGIATISDSVIPYLGETLLHMPNRGIHIGFIEKWWLVNPLAIVGVAIAYFTPATKFPHAGHVLLSTWASLFHIIMAIGASLSWLSYIVIFGFLFLAVWVPCCVSDIVFPLLFVRKKRRAVLNVGFSGYGIKLANYQFYKSTVNGQQSTGKNEKLWTMDYGLWTKKGFTLIEVLVVMVILGFIVAMAAQVFMKDDDQRRFDETRLRMEEIKKAILGSEGAYANGQRQFAGYVADMGGLPNLVDENGVADPNGQPKGLWTRDFNADGDTIDPVDIPDSVIWGHRAMSQTWMGWRGPYIETPPLKIGETLGQVKLRDGWGNPFRFATGGGDITIESYGADGVVGGTEFNEDIALVIRQTKYMAPVAGRVDGGVTDVRIYYPVAGTETTCAISGLGDGDYFRFELTAPAPGNIDIPVGLRSIAISKDNGATWSTDYIFTVEPTGNWLGTLE